MNCNLPETCLFNYVSASPELCPVYTIAAIQDYSERERFLAKLADKTFKASLTQTCGAFAFAVNECFDSTIFVYRDAFEDRHIPQEGSLISIEVALRYDEKKGRWGFNAVHAELISAPDDTLRIYIDEAWVGTVPDAARPQHEGVIAGIVWFGDAPDYEMLPQICTHLRTGTVKIMKESVQNVLKCSRCFPFIMPIRIQNEADKAQRHYDLLLQTCIKVLLGWMLQERCKAPKDIHLFMEQIYQHTSGEDVTQHFIGYLSAMKERMSGRFDSWHILEARFVDKDYEYVPYADLLGYMTHDHTDIALALGAQSDYRNLPGYLPITIDLSQQLDDIDRLEDLGNVEQILNFVSDTQGTALCRTIMADLKKRLTTRKDLQEKLIGALEERYQKKERDLRQLRMLSSSVTELAGMKPADMPKRIKLMLFALQLQDANHHGDPERATAVREDFQRIRNEVRIHDRELAAYVDLNVAVSYADSFQFSEAKSCVESVTQDSHYEALTPAMQGRAYSALGQYHAMLGEGEKAEACFVQALAQFDIADLKPEEREGERWQTGIYRAINAMDARLPQVHELVHAIVPLEENAIIELAGDGLHKNEYRHHLLVRALYLLPELKDL